jgi:hypothetical protein
MIKKKGVITLFYFRTVHPLPEVDLDLKENDFIVLPPNLRRSVRRLRKNRQKKLGEDQHSNIRKKRQPQLRSIFVSNMTTI